MDIAERARKCVVFIAKVDPSRGTFTPLGTGFLGVKTTNRIQFQHVVTARHVIDEMQGDDIWLRVNTTEGGMVQSNGARSELLKTHKKDWFWLTGTTLYHDIAVCPLMLRQTYFDVVHLDFDGEVMDEVKPGRFPEVGDEIFVTGLFTSHQGETHNIPIVRFGNISATVADEPILTESGPMHGYLVEVKSLGGLSGSPVFVHFRESSNFNVTRSVLLLGLMHGHFLVENPEDAISITGKDKSTGQINTGIGLVVPGACILDVLSRIDLIKRREQ
jgi:hypothetical protein